MGIQRPLGRTVRVHGWRLATFLCAATLLLAIFGAANASAAQNICVGTDSTNVCPDDWPAPATLEAAVPLASDSELTNIYVTPGTYSSASGVIFPLSKRIKLIGVGPGRPTLTIDDAVSYPAETSVLTTFYADSIENLEIALPTSTGLTGIRAAINTPDISDVSVQGPSADSSIGIHVSESSPSVDDTTINLGASGSTGVFVDGSTSATIDDVTVTHASKAVELQGAMNFKIRRMKSQSANGVVAASSSGTVSSSVIMPSAVGAENSGGNGVSASSTTGQTRDVNVDNCTLIGGGTGTTGVAASATGAATVQSIDVNSSVISGYETSADTTSITGGTATVNLAYSRFTSGVQGAATVAASSQQTNADFGFVNAAADNYALTLTSPLIDAGDPAGLTADDSGSDASDKPRVVSRGAGLIRDIGAYEVQNTAPVPKIQIVTAVPSTTSNTLFSAAGSTDAEGDAMTYDWKFDGAPGVSGLTTQKMFILDGPHSVQLTVTDKTGAASQTSAQFNVARGFLPLKIRSQNATLSRKGTFKITLSCPAEAISNCSGRLLFQTTKKVNAKNYTERPTWAAAKKSKPAYLQAARYVFSVAPGTTKKIEVRTYSTFQNVLGVHKKFKIQSSLVFGTTSNANLTANRATFTISAPKPKKK
jgi:hypothetical protein